MRVFKETGAVFGLYGVIVVSFALLCGICSMRSFGAPYVAPIAPKRRKNADIILRMPLWQMKRKMFYANSESGDSK